MSTILFAIANKMVKHHRNHLREAKALEPTIVVLKLNQQQLELLDKTIASGAAADRETLVRLALREYAARHARPAVVAISREAENP